MGTTTVWTDADRVYALAGEVAGLDPVDHFDPRYQLVSHAVGAWRFGEQRPTLAWDGSLLKHSVARSATTRRMTGA
jgi:hypothetical protein